MSKRRRTSPKTPPCLRALQAFLKAQKWKVRFDGPLTLHGTVCCAGMGCPWVGFAAPDNGTLEFSCLSPVKVPPERRLRVAEYLTRANYDLRLGGFEMDFADGAVRFRIVVPLDPLQSPTDLVLIDLVYGCCAITDSYLPGLMRVIFGDVQPEQAIVEVESTGEEKRDAGEDDDAEEDSCTQDTSFYRRAPSEN